jgi:hypothetical protein
MGTLFQRMRWSIAYQAEFQILRHLAVSSISGSCGQAFLNQISACAGIHKPRECPQALKVVAATEEVSHPDN